MTNSMRIATVLLGAAGLLVGGCRKSDQANIGTGGVTGVYYPAGQAIAKLFNRSTDQHGVSLSVQSTAGSVFNINAVLAGELDFGICQSDRQYQAFHGRAEWSEAGRREQLRAVCSLHPEAVYLVAAEDAGIRTLDDLRGKVVNIGNPGSGQRGNALDVLAAAGIDVDNDIQAEAYKASEAPQELQNGRIDAFFYTVGHGAGAIRQAVAGQARRVRFVPIVGMERLLAERPYYGETVIPLEPYPQAANDQPVPTIGLLSTVVTSEAVDEELVYQFTRSLFENLDEFKQAVPAMAELTPEGMLRGLSAPIHPGAARYYREAGLMD